MQSNSVQGEYQNCDAGLKLSGSLGVSQFRPASSRHVCVALNEVEPFKKYIEVRHLRLLSIVYAQREHHSANAETAERGVGCCLFEHQPTRL
jgi:hypothetical protein